MTTPVNTTATFSVEAEGEGLTYQWEYCPNTTTWKNNTMSGATTNTLTFTAKAYHDGYKYRCLITDANGNSVRTDEVTLTIGVPAEFTVDDVTYRIIADTTVEVLKYLGTAASVTIPTTVNGYTVTAIGESAFEGNTTLTSIDLPDTIEVIGKRAFANCTNLSDVH